MKPLTLSMSVLGGEDETASVIHSYIDFAYDGLVGYHWELILVKTDLKPRDWHNGLPKTPIPGMQQNKTLPPSPIHRGFWHAPAGVLGWKGSLCRVLNGDFAV